MTRARSLSRLANSQAFTVDSDLDVGINSTSPSSKLDVGGNIIVSGVVTATSFVGDVTGNADTATTSTYATTAGIATVAENLTGNPSISVTDITATGNVSIAGTLTYEDVTSVDSVGIITAQSGIDVTGGDINVGTATTITDGGLNVTGVVTATSFSGDGSSVTNVNATTLDSIDSGSFLRSDAADTKTSGNLTFNDNINANFGTGDDLRIYHNGSNSYIDDGSGTGALIFKSNTYSFRNAADNEQIAVFNENGSVDLYYDNSKKIETTGGGIQVTGVVTATSFSGDGSTLTGVESGVADFVATGTIPNGSTVIVNADGTVSVPVQTSLSTPIAGDSELFEFAQVLEPSAAFDPINQKVVIAYTDVGNSSYGTAVVGTVIGNTITFGTPVVFESNLSEHCSVVYDSANQKIVIAYRTSVGTQARAIVGTVTGDTITFGTFTGFASSSTSISATYDSTNQKVVIAYRDSGSGNFGTGIVGTVSGTSISFGTPTVFENSNVSYISATYDSANGKVVVAYVDLSTVPNVATAVVGTVSGTSISFGTPVVFNSATTLYTEATYDSANGKVVVAYRDNGNLNYGTAIVGTVSGTSISFGTPVVFLSNDIGNIYSTYDSANGKVTIVYQDIGNSSYGTAILGTVSGTTISFGTPVVFESASSQYLSATYDPFVNRVVVAYRDNGNSGWGSAVVLANSSSTLTEENYIGIAAEAISNGATGKINIIGGINNGQTGLTVARKYYTDTTGGIGLTPSNPSVVAGVSISSTEIIVKGSTSNDSSSSSTYISDGDWNLISTITASNAATASFTSGIDSTYDTYAIIGTNLQPIGTSNGKQLYMRFSTDGGSSYISSNTYGYISGNNSTTTSAAMNFNSIQVTGNIAASSADTDTRGSFKLFLNNFSSSQHKTGYGEASSTFLNGGNDWINYVSYGFVTNTTSAINAIQFFFDVDNISTGTFRLYGINNS